MKIAPGQSPTPSAPRSCLRQACLKSNATCSSHARRGGVLDATTIPRLSCSAVAGAANNQLGEREDADRLRDTGILWAPDFVINSGGVLHGVGLELLGWTPDELTRRLEGIGTTLES